MAWAAAGLFFGFSEIWQLIINSRAAVVTFLMVLEHVLIAQEIALVIQNAQNRDGEAIQAILDEIVLATENVRETIIDIETLGDA